MNQIWIIINLANNGENMKYIFNDNILKFVIFNNEIPNPEVIKNILNIKINEFLVNVNLINKENQKKNENLNVNKNIANKPNDINKNNEVNNNNNNNSNNNINSNLNKNKNISERNANNQTNKGLETQSSKKHIKLNSTLVHSTQKGNPMFEQKKQLAKNLNKLLNIKIVLRKYPKYLVIKKYLLIL